MAESKQLSQDLRKSHFQIGHPDYKQPNSEYNRKYQAFSSNNDPNLKDKLNLRASHFSLGDAQTQTSYKSTLHKDFKSHAGFVPPSLNAEKKKDLRSHHFSFGGSQVAYNTVSHSNYTEKAQSLTQKQEQEEAKAKMIAHSHNFNEVGNKQRKSEYNSHFNKGTDSESLKQGLSAQQLKDKVVSLRKSHINLGEDNRNMQSVSKKDYTQQGFDNVKPANDNVAIRRTNFVLGENEGGYNTINADYYVQHPKQAREMEVFEALRKDLRTHHFNFGTEDPNYATNNMKDFKKHENVKASAFDPSLQSNHWEIGAEGGTMLGNKTSYQRAHKDFGNAHQAQARDQTQDRGSNWSIGQQKTPYVSDYKSRFQNFGDGRQNQDAALKGDLRASHFGFDDVKPQYKTTSGSSFIAIKGDPGRLNEDLKKDLRASHFGIGSKNGNSIMKSVNASTYSAQNGKPSDLDPEMARELRSHHFSYGSGKWEPFQSSEYRMNFAWKNSGDKLV